MISKSSTHNARGDRKINTDQSRTIDQSPSNICMAPWTNIHVGTMENLQPCCAGAGIDVKLDQLPVYLGDANQDLLAVKKFFLQGQTPSACRGCQERGWYSQFQHQAPTALNDFTLLSLDLRWSNTCQLTCMYCNAGQSSAWAAAQNRTGSAPISARIRDRTALLQLIDTHRSTIQRVSLLGGEPLLIKENLQVLELLGPDIEVSIFSGFNVDLATNPVYKVLIDMPNVYWTISMENVGEKFEFVRRGSSWSRQLQNLDHLMTKNRSRYTVTLQSQFCVYSATSVTELYDLVQDRDIKVNWNWLSHPQALDFALFPDCVKSIAMDQLHAAKTSANKFQYEPQVDHVIDTLRASLGQGGPEHVSACRQWHAQMESEYFNNQLDFLALWPEFAV